jgi:hypothetical protein
MTPLLVNASTLHAPRAGRIPQSTYFLPYLPDLLERLY